MRFAKLDVERVPGIDRPFALDDLGRGAILIVGPNGCGKSRTGLTMSALLFPEKAAELDDGRASAVLEHGGERFLAEFDGGEVKWRREDGERLPDPAEGRAHAFHLPARSLWRTEGHDDFGRELARRVAGGFDLEAVREHFHLGPRSGAELGKAVNAARSKEKRALRELDALAREEESIAALEARRRDAAAAAREVELLRDAASAAEAVAELQRTQVSLEVFPPVLEHTREDGLEDLERAEAEWIAADRTAAEARARAGAADDALANATSGPDEEALRAAREYLQTARRCDESARSLREDLARANARATQARTDAGLAEHAPLPGADTLGELEVRARNERAVRGELAEVEQRLGIVAGANSLVTRTSHLIVGGLLIAAGSAAAVLIDPWFIAAAGMGLGWLARTLLTDGRERLTLRVKREELERQLGELELQSAGLRGALGLASDAPAATLLESFAARQELRTALTEVEGLLARRAELEAQSLESLERIGDALRSEMPPDAARAVAQLEAEERRFESRREVQARASGARQDAERAETEVARVAARREEAFARLHLVPGDLAAAEALLARRQEYIELKRLRDEQVGRQTEALARLDESKHLAHEPAEEIERRLASAEKRAAEQDELSEQIASIRTRMEEARRNDPWQEAAAERERLEAQAEELFEEGLIKLCAQHLGDEVRREHRETSSPRVMQRADDLLGRFTRGRYRLELGDGSKLAAIDGESGRTFALDQLSDGTRVQLLLAVRLAFAETMEAPGERLPWILDEAFGAADGERLRELVGTVLEVASEGRQVIYLSAHPSEAVLWAQIAQELSLPSPQIVDLAQVRGLARSETSEFASSLPERRVLPDPAALSDGDWATAVGADVPRRYDAPERLHLYHLLRGDRDALRALAEDGIERLGVFENARAAASVALADEALEKRMAARVATARATIEAWHVGRGRPLERADVRATGVPAKYVDTLCTLSEQLGRSASALLAALEDKKQRKELLDAVMRDTTLEKFEAGLVQRGVIDPSDPLDRDAVLGRALAAASEHRRALEKGEAAQIAGTLVDYLESSVEESELPSHELLPADGASSDDESRSSRTASAS